MTETKPFSEKDVLQFIRDAPDRSAYCIEGVSGGDVARYFAEQFGASDVEVFDVLDKLRQANLVAYNVMVDLVVLTDEGAKFLRAK
ncbi:MAG: hypothetical protein GC190_15995 [Alphaproteobacteria bacterium]|nr:hypothetical protein [Alphaproteobacteria bacterium]